MKGITPKQKLALTNLLLFLARSKNGGILPTFNSGKRWDILATSMMTKEMDYQPKLAAG
jgi:hypothetical protein